jgi:hypothetical protein
MAPPLQLYDLERNLKAYILAFRNRMADKGITLGQILLWNPSITFLSNHFEETVADISMLTEISKPFWTVPKIDANWIILGGCINCYILYNH